ATHLQNNTSQSARRFAQTHTFTDCKYGFAPAVAKAALLRRLQIDRAIVAHFVDLERKLAGSAILRIETLFNKGVSFLSDRFVQIHCTGKLRPWTNPSRHAFSAAPFVLPALHKLKRIR